MAAEKPVIISDDTPEEAKTELKFTRYVRFNSGDTLESISEKYMTPVEEIISYNKINPAALQVGHWLYV